MVKLAGFTLNMPAFAAICGTASAWVAAHQVGISACFTALDIPHQAASVIGWVAGGVGLLATSQMAPLFKKG
jgi:hypothetical protein